MTDLTLRSLSRADEDFLCSMLYEAAHWRPGAPKPPVNEALRSPDLRVYVERWGREVDRGVIAVADREPLGAAWYRTFTETAHGYGFVDDDTPELTVGVAPARRRLGVGRALLTALIVQARLDGVSGLSLSVEDDNPARRLYEQLGFEPVAQVGNASTMLLRWPARA